MSARQWCTPWATSATGPRTYPSAPVTRKRTPSRSDARSAQRSVIFSSVPEPMTIRDSRSDDFPEPPTQPGDAGRESTQSLDLVSDELEPGELARGTHDPQAPRL